MKHYGWGIADKDGNHPLNTPVEWTEENANTFVSFVNKLKNEYRNGPYTVVELFIEDES